MIGLTTLIRLQRWRLDEKRRKLNDLERLLEDLNAQSTSLEDEILSEQEAATGSIEGGYAYPGYAEAAIGRRDNLNQSIEDLDKSIGLARDEVATAFETVKTYQQAEDREQKRAHSQLARREQLRLDEIGLNMHRQQERL